MELFISLRIVLCSLWMVRIRALNINRDNAGLSSVPQDLNVLVTALSLKSNDITVIDNRSLWQYHDLKKLDLTANPLQKIKPGSFENNPKLEVLVCLHCTLYQLPADFGPATHSLKQIWFLRGIRNATTFHQMQLSRFVNLSSVSLKGIRGINFNILNFPISVAYLGIGRMQLITFPNLSFARFPKLKTVNAELNTFQVGSNFVGVTEKIGYIGIDSSNLYSADGLNLLTNLEHLKIRNNNLDILPDLLGLPRLKALYMNGNSRMNCDKRMCWRRLWDRVKNPLQESDDVRCVKPPLLAGHYMSKVNPKFMQCSDGKCFDNIGIEVNIIVVRCHDINFVKPISQIVLS